MPGIKKTIAFVVLMISILGAFWLYSQHEAASYLTINGHKINVEVASTPLQRQQGLAHRDSLAANAGMLFLFPDVDIHFFWMKGMKFPLDIIWIKGDKVVGISPNVPVPTGPDYPHYKSPEPIDKVLEINANAASKWGISSGQTIKYHLPEP